mmetsp:Transcript_8476/g.14378  ORF Transcript_8476/g.14378 Transcript_8476/m.14378 type:complete len:337 (+) Transcript_8476:340-1350(+)
MLQGDLQGDVRCIFVVILIAHPLFACIREKCTLDKHRVCRISVNNTSQYIDQLIKSHFKGYALTRVQHWLKFIYTTICARYISVYKGQNCLSNRKLQLYIHVHPPHVQTMKSMIKNTSRPKILRMSPRLPLVISCTYTMLWCASSTSSRPASTSSSMRPMVSACASTRLLICENILPIFPMDSSTALDCSLLYLLCRWSSCCCCCCSADPPTPNCRDGCGTAKNLLRPLSAALLLLFTSSTLELSPPISPKPPPAASGCSPPVLEVERGPPALFRRRMTPWFLPGLGSAPAAPPAPAPAPAPLEANSAYPPPVPGTLLLLLEPCRGGGWECAGNED